MTSWPVYRTERPNAEFVYKWTERYNAKTAS